MGYNYGNEDLFFWKGLFWGILFSCLIWVGAIKLVLWWWF